MTIQRTALVLAEHAYGFDDLPRRFVADDVSASVAATVNGRTPGDMRADWCGEKCTRARESSMVVNVWPGTHGRD
jgi:hypothetical protein